MSLFPLGTVGSPPQEAYFETNKAESVSDESLSASNKAPSWQISQMAFSIFNSMSTPVNWAFSLSFRSPANKSNVEPIHGVQHLEKGIIKVDEVPLIRCKKNVDLDSKILDFNFKDTIGIHGLDISLKSNPKIKIRVLEQNIFDADVEVIVNAANLSLVVEGNHGINAQIIEGGGEEYKKEHAHLKEKFSRLGEPFAEGDAALITSGNLNLLYEGIKNVVVVAAPNLQSYLFRKSFTSTHATQLYYCYLNSLVLAHHERRKSIGFPSLGTGIYRVPFKEAAQIALQAIQDFYAEYADTNLNEVSIHVLGKGSEEVIESYREALKNEI